MTADGPARDPEVAAGDLAEERTELAWSRSGLTLFAACAIITRRVWIGGTRGEKLLTLALFGAVALGWAVTTIGHGNHRRRSTEPSARAPRDLLAVSLGIVAVALAGILVSFLDV